MAGRSKERLYREQEVAEILQREAGIERRLQQEKPALSLSEIEAIARERIRMRRTGALLAHRLPPPHKRAA